MKIPEMTATGFTCQIPSRLVEGEPEDEDGDSGVLDASLDCDGDDVLRCAPKQFGSQTSEAEAQPRQGQAGEDDSPKNTLWRKIKDENVPKRHRDLSNCMPEQNVRIKNWIAISLPSHEPEDVKIGPNAKDDDEENEKEGQWFQDTNHKLGNLREISEIGKKLIIFFYWDLGMLKKI